MPVFWQEHADFLRQTLGDVLASPPAPAGRHADRTDPEAWLRPRPAVWASATG